MSAVFTINFRREVYRQELARTRRRTVALGVWVAYFGALAIVLGLYGMNCASLARRTRLLEAQNARVRSTQGPTSGWKPDAADLAMVEGAVANPRRWQARLTRLAAVLPPNAALSSIEVNPNNLPDAGNHEMLVLTGELRPLPGQDRMKSVMGLIETLRRDSVFAATYSSIKLAESRIEGGAAAPASFRIECR